MTPPNDDSRRTGAPPVDVVLPDRQQLRGRLYARHQTRDGRWLYRVGLVLWTTVPGNRAEPGEYKTWVAVENIHPVEGADYGTVETTREPPPPPPVVSERLRPTDRWRLVRGRKRADTGFQWLTVHRHDCWTAKEGEEIDESRAREVMAEPNGRGCSMCGTDYWFGTNSR